MSEKNNKKDIAAQIFKEYRNGIEFKNNMGSRGIYEQTKMNERFYVGDQWHGAKCGNDRPLVRHNIIKRIGDYKIAMIGSSPISVNYSADGIPSTSGMKKDIEGIRDTLKAGEIPSEDVMNGAPDDEMTNLVMASLSDYFRVTAERVKLDSLKEQVLRNSYISGTGILYTYWDDNIKTGLFADRSKTKPILGDIACEVLDIENVYFGDPNEDDVQKQPYIIIAQRRRVCDLKKEAKTVGLSDYDIEKIKPDEDRNYQSGEYGEVDLNESKKTTVLTKLWKKTDKEGNISVHAVRVCEGVTVKPEWNVGIRLYPIAKFCWERRRNNAYGESEITYLIPNQIAINRMLTANVWAVMMLGMPLTLVNNDLVPEVTNEPGQIIRVSGNPEDMAGAIRYIVPPNFSPNFQNNIAELISNTLTQAGANDAALGDMRPDNMSAIVAVREAATMPLQTTQNRYYQFMEDVARIFAEFWVCYYGERALRMEDGNDVWYMPFDGGKYRNLIVNARVDVGAATLYGEAQTIKTLDALLDRQIINLKQYLERVPKGLIPNVTGLIKELEKAEAQQAAMQQAAAISQTGKLSEGTGSENWPSPEEVLSQVISDEDILAGLSDKERQIMSSLPPEVQNQLLNRAKGGTTNDGAENV